MRFWLVLFIGVIVLVSTAIRVVPQQTMPAKEPGKHAFAVRVSVGHQAGRPGAWSGSFAAENAEITGAKGWRTRRQDRLAINRFEILAIDQRTNTPYAKGVELRGTSGSSGQISFSTSHGNFSFRIADLALGAEREFLDKEVRVTRLLDTEKLTGDSRFDDYPSIAVVDNQFAWAAWQSYGGGADEIRLSKYDNGWRTFTRVPGTSGDVWQPQVAVDGQGLVWVIWSQQVKGNFDLWARALDEKNNVWQAPVRLSSHPNPDINHHVAADRKGGLWVVWQGFHGDNSDIFLRRYEAGAWSGELRVTDDRANDWEPRVAVDHQNRGWIVWDSYRNGNYDVLMRSFQGNRLGSEVVVAGTARFEAHAAVAVDMADRVWVAWDEGGPNWGKDTGLTVDPRVPIQKGFDDWVLKPTQRGTRLYDGRQVQLAVFEAGRRKTPAQDLQTVLASQGIQSADYPQLIADDQSGQVALLFHRWTLQGSWGKNMESRQMATWELAVSVYGGNQWSPALTLPDSASRPSTRGAAVFSPGGDLWAIWPTDGRVAQAAYQPVADNVFAARIPTTRGAGRPELKEWREPKKEIISAAHPQEARDVTAIRTYRTYIDGAENRIVRGDLHRHTELSWDNGGLRDGSLFDFYRYMLDAAAMDFGAVTDHFGGGEYDYWWWLTEKSCDLFHVPRVYTTLYGYERSVQYPDGHRNVFHTRRGMPMVALFTEPKYAGARPGITAPSKGLMQNDTKLLYESLRNTGGISIPHTSGSFAGTDWRDNDPDVEPLVELYQGARVSYEYPGAPRAPRNAQDIGDFREPGFVWNAYRKGYRLGTIASSDHWSTHMSYAMVFTEQPTREAIFSALKKRRTYGATDNIVLDYRMGEHFMGDEFTATQTPPLRLRVAGTGSVSQVEIIRNEKIIYSTNPGKKDVSFSFVDPQPQPGKSYYYVRVTQADLQMAWGSPIWVNVVP